MSIYALTQDITVSEFCPAELARINESSPPRDEQNYAVTSLPSGVDYVRAAEYGVGSMNLFQPKTAHVSNNNKIIFLSY